MLAELLPVANANATDSHSGGNGDAGAVLASATLTLPRLALAAANVDPHAFNSSGASVTHGLTYRMNYSTPVAQVRFPCQLRNY